MDLDPTDDQRELQATVARFAADRFPLEGVVRSWATDGGFDRGRWGELAGLGTFGIAVPEDQGGVGLGVADAVLVHEALGGALTPGPLVAASVLAGLVDGVVDGEVVPALVWHEGDGPVIVEHLRDADVLVVLSADGARRVDASALERTDLRPSDPTTPVSRVDSLPSGEAIADAEGAARLRLLGSLLASAQLVGLAEAATTLAVGYAQERQQFGRPIGSFQGLKHLMADSYVRQELARSAVWSAGVTVDEPDAGDLGRAVAGAKLLAAKAGTENAKTCMQVHGGMGFTWEVDAHLYLKRAWVLEAALGSPDEAAEAIAATLVA
jgi:alkylation response protein AidB-like acyl-CoA dehydrogenase